MIAIKRLNGIDFRLAAEGDISGIVSLEKDVWGDNAADEEKIYSRIKTFPEGNIIALSNNQVVGYVAIQFVDNVAEMPNFSWAEITDNGKIAKSHKPNGKYVYGINMSVHHSMNGKDLATILAIQGLSVMILQNKKGSFLGSRIPGFRNYKASSPNIDVCDYIKLRRNGKLRDYELRLYEKEGLFPVKVLVDYFPDEASLNYGVLVYRRNQFYNLPFRRIWNWLFLKIALRFVKKS